MDYRLSKQNIMKLGRVKSDLVKTSDQLKYKTVNSDKRYGGSCNDRLDTSCEGHIKK